MTRVQRTVLWTLAVLVFGYIAVHILIVKAPGQAQAQQPATGSSGSTRLPEDVPTRVESQANDEGGKVDGNLGVIRGPDKNVVPPIEKTIEALTEALKESHGITLAIGRRNILLPMLESADAKSVAKEILNAIGDNERIGLYLLNDGVLIHTAQQDLERPDLRDACRITTAIIDALAK